MLRTWPAAATLAAAFLAPGPGAAHGTSEPGPHGGEIRMPGAFHVEALARENAVMVYLLDMQFEQPRVTDSSVEVELEQDGRTAELDCGVASEARAFKCRLPDDATLSRGTLVVDASRGGKPAKPARYELPLAWSEKQQGSGG